MDPANRQDKSGHGTLRFCLAVVAIWGQGGYERWLQDRSPIPCEGRVAGLSWPLVVGSLAAAQAAGEVAARLRAAGRCRCWVAHDSPFEASAVIASSMDAFLAFPLLVFAITHLMKRPQWSLLLSGA